MLIEMMLSIEFTVAIFESAFEWFFFGMGEDMQIQFTFAIKLTFTITAGKRLDHFYFNRG